ncbi:hypothetical protein ACLMJV_08115 [Sinorhizobium meliloti]|uniref:hypothetical protein n=1 Tax=Sinorhizobium TaxID=28105 RepID=UPI0023D7BD0F|nr:MULTISPECIES: hypothetical protein [unclassified Sinorhizobium]WEJ10782.1 hypothetical protein N0Q90_06395 [Sinorhizobium sp. M103]WEJ14635.1 hypothetical protein N0Q91_13925 [Sinorhizobium sp. K101]WEJ37760.1 hypothetical protein N0R80_06370 [Sinorhizobium sp. C101]
MILTAMLASCKLGFPADIARKGQEYKPHAEKNAALPKDFKAIPGSGALKLGSVLSARMAMRLNSSRGDCAVYGMFLWQETDPAVSPLPGMR